MSLIRGKSQGGWVTEGRRTGPVQRVLLAMENFTRDVQAAGIRFPLVVTKTRVWFRQYSSVRNIRTAGKIYNASNQKLDTIRGGEVKTTVSEDSLETSFDRFQGFRFGLYDIDEARKE